MPLAGVRQGGGRPVLAVPEHADLPGLRFSIYCHVILSHVKQ